MKCEYCLGVFCWYGVLVHSQKDMTTVNRLQHVKAIWNDLNGTARKLCQVSLPNPEALLWQTSTETPPTMSWLSNGSHLESVERLWMARLRNFLVSPMRFSQSVGSTRTPVAAPGSSGSGSQRGFGSGEAYMSTWMLTYLNHMLTNSQMIQTELIGGSNIMIIILGPGHAVSGRVRLCTLPGHMEMRWTSPGESWVCLAITLRQNPAL